MHIIVLTTGNSRGGEVPNGKPFSYSLFPGATVRAKSQIDFIKEGLGIDSFEGWHVLDIGCHPGVLLKMFKDAGATTQGIEPDTTFAKYIEEELEIPVENGILERVNLSKSHYDLICMSHALEHFTNPANALYKVHLAVRAGGSVFIEVPYHAREDFSAGRFTGPHLSFFTPKNLNTLPTRTGFENVRISTCGRPKQIVKVQRPFFKETREILDFVNRTSNPAVKIGIHAFRKLRQLCVRGRVTSNTGLPKSTLEGDSIYFRYYDGLNESGQWIRTVQRKV